MIDKQILHTASVCTSILVGMGSILGGIWKLVTNHIFHMKHDIIHAVNESGDKTCKAIELASKDIVIAVLRGKS